MVVITTNTALGVSVVEEVEMMVVIDRGENNQEMFLFSSVKTAFG